MCTFIFDIFIDPGFLIIDENLKGEGEGWTPTSRSFLKKNQYPGSDLRIYF